MEIPINKNIIIVASGPSLRKMDPSLFLDIGCRVIAVNGAIEWLPFATDFFTLDPSPSNVRRMTNNRIDVDYHCAINDHPLRRIPGHVKLYKRLATEPKHIRPIGTPEYWFKRWGCLKGLSEDKGSIHSGNSAYGALGLAYHWRPKKILLLGVDGTQEPRMNDEGPPKYNISHLPLLFKSALPQLNKENIEVKNGSIGSAVKCFDKTTIEEGLEWIQQ